MRNALTLFIAAATLAGAALAVMYWNELAGRVGIGDGGQDGAAPAGKAEPGPADLPHPGSEEAAAAELAGGTSRILLPAGLRDVRFGVSPEEISRRFPPSWRRESRDGLMLVHHFNETKTPEARFQFPSGEGLQSVELRFKADVPAETNALYGELRAEAERSYGGLPGSRSTRWTDGHLSLHIRKGLDHVALVYREEGQ